MSRSQIEERIRSASSGTQQLIVKLNTLAERVDTAKKNGNSELVAYYEKQFTETATAFMTGVEVIVDDWYALKGEKRVRMDNEPLGATTLQELATEVAAISGLPLSILPQPIIPLTVDIPKTEHASVGVSKSPHKVDLRG